MIDLHSVTGATSHFGAIALGVAFVAGVAASLGPASYALVPAIVGFGVGVAGDQRRTLFRAALASVGLMLVSAIGGAVAGAVGASAVQWFGANIVVLYAIGAVALAIVGLRFLGAVRLHGFGVAPSFATARGGSWEAFALGSALAVASCPACTPLLLAVVLGAVALAQPLAGALLLAAFGLGRTLPIFALALSASVFAKLRRLRPFLGAFERAGGVLLLISAVYLSYEAIATWIALHTGGANPMTGMSGM